MSVSHCRFIKQWSGPWPRDELKEQIPENTRGLYALLKKVRGYRDRDDNYDVVYIGMARGSSRGSIKFRINRHKKGTEKIDGWTHFSAFEVHDNISPEEIIELEALLREIYADDRRANSGNTNKHSAKLKGVKVKELSDWGKNKQIGSISPKLHRHKARK